MIPLPRVLNPELQMKVLYGDQSREPVQISSPEKTPGLSENFQIKKNKNGKKFQRVQKIRMVL